MLKSRKFEFKKLVRDKIIREMIKSGDKPTYRVLNRNEYIIELKKKLLEEVLEIPMVTQKHNLTEEIADIQEILDNILVALKINKSKIQKIQLIKKQKNGSFRKRAYIDFVETKEGSKWIDYYLNNPDKYPEVK